MSQRAETPKLAEKKDEGRATLDLIDPHFEVGIARALEHGARKYAPWNHLGGFSTMRCYASIKRHLNAWASGEDLDPESGVSHLAMAGAQLMFLHHQEVFKHRYGHLDDRPRFEEVEIKEEDDRWS